MPLFLDIHREVEGLTPEAIETAHSRDLELQHQYGVTLMKYWYDVNTRTAFCLMLGPNKEACIALHGNAHGMLAAEIFEVTEGKEPDIVGGEITE